MTRTPNIALVQEIMLDYARLTGLAQADEAPRRYLWTDAFAVCNYLELLRQTQDESYLDLTLRLVDQVHHTLGRHRDDDTRNGWISGLDSEEGERHPTQGGLRIGKKLNERKADEPPDERLEWDQDGQYYHYLTKWMHALNRVSRATRDPKYLGWAMELAKASHVRFTYIPRAGGRKRMYWKMSIDLRYPLVYSMGQHDPLDGLVTYSELQAAATTDFKNSSLPDLKREIAEMADICRGMSALATSDPLGIGGLLFDAFRIAQLIGKGGFAYDRLLETVVYSALLGIESFARGRTLELPAEYRLAFRELGLSIGLAAVEDLQGLIEETTSLSGENRLLRLVEDLLRYLPLEEQIERFWADGENRKAATWIEHREINMVMLATSLAPGEFLTI
ncbi:MAG TPA: hypothetical protein VLY86_00170 [Methanothrix sp.]|nr:hypothetical protein [Methanothrix sp.]